MLRAATLPAKHYTSFVLLGARISMIAFTFLGLASTPLWDTMNPRNFLAETPKAHLLGLSFMLFLLNV